MRMELQEHLDTMNIFFDDPENAAQVHESEERIKEIRFWLAHEMPSEELEQIHRFEEAGYVPWTKANGEIHFIKNVPEDMSVLSVDDVQKLYSSWRNAGQEMQAEILCSEERIKQLRRELEIQKFENIDEALDRPSATETKQLIVSLEKVIEDLAARKDHVVFAVEGLQECIDDLLPYAKKFGFVPKAAARFSPLVKQETVQ